MRAPGAGQRFSAGRQARLHFRPRAAQAGDAALLLSVLERVRAATTTQAPLRSGEVATHGTGKHLGCKVAWAFRWRRADGAFCEEVRSSRLSFRWGWSGGATMCWEVDAGGVSRHLSHDDHEALLLAALVRSGCWLDPEVGGKHLELRLSHAPREAGHVAAAAAAAAAAVATAAAADASASGTAAGPGTSSGRSARAQEVVLCAKLRGGKVEARIGIDTGTWVPRSFRQPLCGEQERWEYGGWRSWAGADGLRHPAVMRHHAYAGGTHTYEAVRVEAAAPAAGTYRMPPCALLPSDTTFDDSVKPAVHGFQTASGHTLVPVDLNGTRAGLFILDTGASGFVVERQVADQLGLERFGQFHVAAVAGKVQTLFRRATTLAVGPLTVRGPVLMEMSLVGVVRGAPSRVVGIIGYDIFRRAVVEVPAAPVPGQASRKDALPAAGGGPGAAARAAAAAPSSGPRTGVPATARAERTAAASFEAAPRASTPAPATGGSGGCAPITLHIRSPQVAAAAGDELVWRPISLIANLPHIELAFATQAGERHSALFMIDSGAGGGDVMFHSRAARLLNAIDYSARGGAAKSRFVKGVGCPRTTRVQLGELAWVECGGVRFERVRALFAVAGGLDVSLYSAGTVCGELLTRAGCVFDYPRLRIGLRRPTPPAQAAPP